MAKGLGMFAVFMLGACSAVGQGSGQFLHTGTAAAMGAHGGTAMPPMRSSVPGGCSEPAARNVGRPGCFMAAEITIEAPPENMYWTAHTFPSAAAAAAAIRAHRWSATTQSHGLFWAHVLASAEVRLVNGRHMATVGPMALPPGAVRARFIESNFPPGMRTSVHSHPGPEGF